MLTPTVKLNDGTEMPAIAFGCGNISNIHKNNFLAIHCGFTHLDGAQVYGNEQSLAVGIQAARKLRLELYIVTKLKPVLGAARKLGAELYG
ncbi:2,5-diketo-D-gluconate reductase A, partial [Mycena crocata]